MKKLTLNENTPITTALEAYPQMLTAFQQIGMCCINESNEVWTIADLCAEHGINAGEFINVLNTFIATKL